MNRVCVSRALLGVALVVTLAGNGRSSDAAVARSSVPAGFEPVSFTADGSALDLTAHGASLWLLGTRPANGPVRHDELARSQDAARTFVTGAGPCFPGLGGELAPTSTQVVWAVCPGGMLAGAS